ncbi:MAG: cation:proton antiporter [Acidobacteria bacterium]|nr:cation:proton antiporter [Acidobacteriota bacterium]
MSNHELSALFFLQLAIILAAVRLAGTLAGKAGQPRVMGEMIAGILIGPTLLGRMFPELYARLIPAASKPIIYAVCQIGIVLYMFIVGLEFQTDLVRQRLRSAISISVSGIVTPFVLGCALAIFLSRNTELFPAHIARWQAMMFMGAAMAITAFPMLARIIYERRLTGTTIGALTLAAGAIDDAAAWCLLAVVLAGLSGSSAIALLAIGGGAAYAAVVFLIAKPLLQRLEVAAAKRGRVTGQMLGSVLMLLMLAAWFTDFVRIYAVFGAFILGAAMPRGIVTRDLQRLLEPVTTNFLVPLFFVYSGLNTQLGLVFESNLLLLALVVTLTACVGKGAGCGFAAKLNGESGRDALSIGVLMNARGMMELILLNLALERGVITPTLFAVMVIMAITTTLIATPLFDLVNGSRLPSGLGARPAPGASSPETARAV